MGKYMRKRKGAGKVAVMEVSQVALGVRTRAKTLALVEQDRKLALARSANPKHQQIAVLDPFQTMDLRSRKLEKVVQEIERPVRGNPFKEGSLNEDGKNLPNVDSISAMEEVECTTRPEVDDVVFHVEVIGSSRTPELSPTHTDGCRICKELPIESALSIPRATLDGSQLRCLESGEGEDPSRSENMPPKRDSGESRAHEVVQGGVTLTDDGLSEDGLKHGQPKVDASLEYASGELGNSSVRRRPFRGSPVSISRDQGGADIDPGSSTRTEFLGAPHDHRMAIHNRMMIQNRRYMRTNLFTDAKAIDELFAAPDTTDREEGKRFTDRYNYDIVNDKPLEGRYEWVPAAEECNTTTPMQHSIDQQQPIRS